MVRIYGYVYVLVLILCIRVGDAQNGSVQQKGIEIFVEHRCYTCHTIKAEADAIQKEKKLLQNQKGSSSRIARKKGKTKG